jgi:hypothetical protein
VLDVDDQLLAVHSQLLRDRATLDAGEESDRSHDGGVRRRSTPVSRPRHPNHRRTRIPIPLHHHDVGVLSYVAVAGYPARGGECFFDGGDVEVPTESGSGGPCLPGVVVMVPSDPVGAQPPAASRQPESRAAAGWSRQGELSAPMTAYPAVECR